MTVSHALPWGVVINGISRFSISNLFCIFCESRAQTQSVDPEKITRRSSSRVESVKTGDNLQLDHKLFVTYPASAIRGFNSRSVSSIAIVCFDPNLTVTQRDCNNISVALSIPLSPHIH